MQTDRCIYTKTLWLNMFLTSKTNHMECILLFAFSIGCFRAHIWLAHCAAWERPWVFVTCLSARAKDHDSVGLLLTLSHWPVCNSKPSQRCLQMFTHWLYISQSVFTASSSIRLRPRPCARSRTRRPGCPAGMWWRARRRWCRWPGPDRNQEGRKSRSL